MQKKTSKIKKSQIYLEVENKTTSYLPVCRSGWWIKFSTNQDHNILLVFTSIFTGQTIVRYYNNEDDAVDFINYVMECDPREQVFR